jgi:hypothetical protein
VTAMNSGDCQGRFRAVPKLVGKTGFEYRFEVAAQVTQLARRHIPARPLFRCQGLAKARSGVRFGHALVYVAKREALGSF